MRRLKNYTRSTMISEKLNGIGLMHVNQEIIRDTEKVTDIYTGQKVAYFHINLFFFFINFVFVEDCIVIIFTFHSHLQER